MSKVVNFKVYATLAQLVEQQTENLRVWSSILRGGTLSKVLLFILFLFVGCEANGGDYASVAIKIYSGSYGYNVAYHVEGGKVYSGSYGYDVAFRVDGSKIYSGSYGYNVAYRIDGNKIYSGSYGYNVAFRVDGNKIYSGGYGYDVAYRIGR